RLRHRLGDDVRGQDLDRAQPRSPGEDLPAPLRAVAGRRQRARPAGPLQPHLPGLRPPAEAAPAGQLPALLLALPARCGIPGARLPARAEVIRTGLLLRSPGFRAGRPRLPRRPLSAAVGTPAVGAP